MKLLPFGVLLLIGFLAPPAKAQTPATPEVAMQQWIAKLDATWQETFTREVSAPFEAEKANLGKRYAAAIESNLAKATEAGNLDQTILWRTERDRFATAMDVPAEDGATVSVTLKQLRADWRAQTARLEKERGEHAKGVLDRYDQVLAQAQKQLTQQKRIDDALAVKKKRDEVAAAWTPQLANTTQPAVPVVPPSPATPPPNPATPAPKPAFGISQGPKLAAVEAENTALAPLNADEDVLAFTDKLKWVTIPKEFQGYQFTKVVQNDPTLRFKALSDGVIYLACTTRFFGNSGADGWFNDEQLHKKGWHKERNVQLADTEKDHQWFVYSRTCKQGESFSIRTEKYRTPILLVK